MTGLRIGLHVLIARDDRHVKRASRRQQKSVCGIMMIVAGQIARLKSDLRRQRNDLNPRIGEYAFNKSLRTRHELHLCRLGSSSTRQEPDLPSRRSRNQHRSGLVCYTYCSLGLRLKVIALKPPNDRARIEEQSAHLCRIPFSASISPSKTGCVKSSPFGTITQPLSDP